jgi:hypothetical protein
LPGFNGLQAAFADRTAQQRLPKGTICGRQINPTESATLPADVAQLASQPCCNAKKAAKQKGRSYWLRP